MLTRIALDSLTPGIVVFARVALGAGLLALLWHLTSRHTSFHALPWADLALFALLGNVVPFFLITWGQQHVDSGTTAILLAVMPLIVAILAHLFLRDERLTLARLAGLLVGFAGVVCVVEPVAGAELTAGGMAFAGKLAVIGDLTLLSDDMKTALHSNRKIFLKNFFRRPIQGSEAPDWTPVDSQG